MAFLPTMLTMSRVGSRQAEYLKEVSSRRICAGILPALLLGLSNSAWALGDQWYIGLGGGASILDPTPADATLEIEENTGTGGSLFLGTDVDETSSVQLQLHSLGKAELSGGEQSSYYAGDASVLYRFADSRDFAPRGTVFGASFYGRFGLGFIERDSTVNLDQGTPIFLGAGAGVEVYLTRNLALRAEGLYLDSDASTFGVSLVGRFGGRRLQIARPSPPPSRSFPAPVEPEQATTTTPTPIPAPLIPIPAPLIPIPAPLSPGLPESAALPETYTPPAGGAETSAADAAPDTIPALVAPTPPTPGLLPPDPESQSLPADTPAQSTPVDEDLQSLAKPDLDSNNDRDNDDVPNEFDECPNSENGFPVLANGCPLLDGVLSGIQFADNTAELLPGSTDQLDFLAKVLAENPDARVELKAFADNSRDEREQSILTRARLKTIGTYLVLEGGVRARRLLLRSFGSSKPLADNDTESGRRENNRIEVTEYPG